MRSVGFRRNAPQSSSDFNEVIQNFLPLIASNSVLIFFISAVLFYFSINGRLDLGRGVYTMDYSPSTS